MTSLAELFALMLVGVMLFRLARPLRDRLEAWFARTFPGNERERVVPLRRRRDGGFGMEDPDGD